MPPTGGVAGTTLSQRLIRGPRPLTDPRARRLAVAAAAIRADPPREIVYLHTAIVQCGLPYGDPGPDIRHWERRQGAVTLRLEAGCAYLGPDGPYEFVGLPYGEKARLILLHLSTEALRKGSPEVDVKASLTAFARALGLNTDGRTLRALHDQFIRLAATTIRFVTVTDGVIRRATVHLIGEYDMYFPTEASGRVQWPFRVQLSPAYYDSLVRHAVPLDPRAVAALAPSAVALDVYDWLAQRLHRIPPGRPQLIRWAALGGQFGQGYARRRDFRRGFLGILEQARAVYPAARRGVVVTEEGLLLCRSSPPVPPRPMPVP